MQYFTLASAVLALATSAAAATATVHNDCKENVYLWSVSADKTSKMITIKPGSDYSETYQTPSVGGVSLKLNLNKTCEGSISQFEYTVAGGSIWYDMSNVNCVGAACPFAPYGWYMDSGKGCPTRSCAAGADICTGAYNAYNDDVNTCSCTDASDISLSLCSSSPSKRSVNVLEAAPHRHIHHIRHPHGSHVRRR